MTGIEYLPFGRRIAPGGSVRRRRGRSGGGRLHESRRIRGRRRRPERVAGRHLQAEAASDVVGGQVVLRARRARDRGAVGPRRLPAVRGAPQPFVGEEERSRPGPDPDGRRERLAARGGSEDRWRACVGGCLAAGRRRRRLDRSRRVRREGLHAQAVRRGDPEAHARSDVIGGQRVDGGRGARDRRAVGAVREPAVVPAAHPLVRERDRRHPGPRPGAREEDPALGRGPADRGLGRRARRPARRRLLDDRARIRGDGRRAHRVRRGDLDASRRPMSSEPRV